MISRRFEKNVLWQVLTVQVKKGLDRCFSLKNNGEELSFSDKYINNSNDIVDIVILTKDELYQQVLERFENNELFKKTNSFEELFRLSDSGTRDPNHISNVIFDILVRAISMKANPNVLDKEYKGKILELTTSSLNTGEIANKLKDLTAFYENQQKVSDRLNEIYGELILSGNGISRGQGHFSDRYRDIYIWIRDIVLLSYQLNNFADVDDEIFAQFRIGNLEDWIPKTFSGTNPINIRETIKQSLVLSVDDVLFIPCKEYLSYVEKEERFLEAIRLDQDHILFFNVFFASIQKKWFAEEFAFESLEDAMSFYRAVKDKFI